MGGAGTGAGDVRTHGGYTWLTMAPFPLSTICHLFAWSGLKQILAEKGIIAVGLRWVAAGLSSGAHGIQVGAWRGRCLGQTPGNDWRPRIVETPSASAVSTHARRRRRSAKGQRPPRLRATETTCSLRISATSKQAIQRNYQNNITPLNILSIIIFIWEF